MAYNNKRTRKLALLELWSAVNEKYEDFSDKEIPGILIDQAMILDKDYRKSWFSRDRVIDKHRNEFRNRIADLLSSPHS